MPTEFTSRVPLEATQSCMVRLLSDDDFLRTLQQHFARAVDLCAGVGG